MDFDKHFKRQQRMFWVAFVFNIAIVLTVLGFIGFVVISLLKHFGIVG